MLEDPFPRATISAPSLASLDLIGELGRRYEAERAQGMAEGRGAIPRKTMRSVVNNDFLKIETPPDARLSP